MAINLTAVWRVRIGGNDLNGGAFDPAIVGAGTDYTEQDVAQLSITDLATASASATATSATGGFTAAMIGNAVRIASGTNFTAGTYFVTAVTDANTVVFDRNCSTAAGSGGVAKLGGAKASLSTPVTHGAIAGNVVMVRGQGSNDPVDIDYNNQYINSGSGVAYVGYNGRPKVSHNGRLFYLVSCYVSNLFLVQTSGTNSEGAFYYNIGQPGAWAVNCVIDTAGFDTSAAQGFNVLNCRVMNSGSQLPGTKNAVYIGGGGSVVNTHVVNQRNTGISGVPGKGVITGNIVQDCAGTGIYLGTAVGNFGAGPCQQNTVHNCGGDGIYVTYSQSVVTGNIVSGISTPGKYGINYAFAENATRSAVGLFGNVFFDNDQHSNLPLLATDLVVDPGFVDAPNDLTPTNIALRNLSGVGVL